MKKSIIRQELRTRITLHRVATTVAIVAIVTSLGLFFYLQLGTSTKVNGATETFHPVLSLSTWVLLLHQ